MAIVVLCPHCRARFQVSEKFAGKQGPCPKCKGSITIPALEEQVKIHVPEQFAAGGKDAKGRAVLKPVERTETKVQPVMVVGIVGAAIVAFVIAWVIGRSTDHNPPAALLAAGAVLLAPPLIVGGYSFLRNQELEPYRGRSLIIRTIICSVVYSAIWAGVWAIHLRMPGELNMVNWLFFGIPPLAIGSLAALSTLDLDIGTGFFHYALYVLVCVLLRLTMGLPPL